MQTMSLPGDTRETCPGPPPAGVDDGVWVSAGGQRIMDKRCDGDNTLADSFEPGHHQRIPFG